MFKKVLKPRGFMQFFFKRKKVKMQNSLSNAVFVSSVNRFGKIFYTLMCVWVHM